jgi:nucleotide-binding universal stress UspA family protein
MSAFDLLLHLRRCDEPTAAVRIGLALARRLGAWTLGLHVVPIASAAFASPEAVAMQVHEADRLYRDAGARAAWWYELLAAHQLQGAWQVAQGDAVEAVCHAARWSQLAVIERPNANPDAPTGWGIVSRSVFGAATPVVVVPEACRTSEAGTRIVVAWNRSRESHLAIRGALPLLERADEITVLAGEPADNPFALRYLPSLDLGAWLTRHGIAARFVAFRPERNHGPALLEAASAAAANLIVMGAWGHSRISELVLGGSTRYLFQNSDVPLLVAH